MWTNARLNLLTWEKAWKLPGGSDCWKPDPEFTFHNNTWWFEARFESWLFVQMCDIIEGIYVMWVESGAAWSLKTKEVKGDWLSNLCFFFSPPASMWPRCRSSSSSCIYWPPWEDLRFGSHWWVWRRPYPATNLHAVCSLLLTVASWCLWFQIPVLNIQMKMVPAICTFLGAIFSCTNYFRVIFTGGVGKNGSTIAVSSVSWMSPSSNWFPLYAQNVALSFKSTFTQNQNPFLNIFSPEWPHWFSIADVV